MKIRTLRSPRSVAVAQTGDGGVSKPLKFNTNWSGFEKLRTFALRMVEAKRATQFVPALEPTGH